MSQVRLALTGTSPLLVHNVQLADPDNKWAKEMASIAAKRSNKTEEDRAALARLEWFGGLYLAPDIEGPVIPTANVKRCLNEAAKSKRWGRDVLRSIHPRDLFSPIIYDGPRDPVALYKREEFVDRRVVAIGRQRVVRVRPVFHPWALVLDVELIEDLMDFDQLVEIGQMAGTIEGLGDNRINGFGRFTFNAERL